MNLMFLLRLRSSYKSFKNKIFDITDIKYYNDNKIKTSFLKFYLIRFLKKTSDKFSGFMNFIIKKIDIKGEKIHILTKINNSNRHIILESSDGVSFIDVLDMIKNQQEYVNIVNKKIIMKCLLKTEDNDNICIKDITKKYREEEQINSHTIENIFLFNQIKYDENSVILLEYFENGRLSKKSFNVKDIKNLHINELFL